MSTSMPSVASTGASYISDSRIPSTATGGNASITNTSTSSVLFREIHKNTWLKRLTADGKKVTVGPKKSERSWVVFCIHDDSQALLEGYAEPRQASSHNPEWVVSMQEAQHISHALIPDSHEFEFVITLHGEVVRFHATSWEVMQEWVETLRSKLREMKIIAPRENLYTKLPEIRAPLLPTRDPTSPLPAPPPVPAALVPGVERVIPYSNQRSADTSTSIAPIIVTIRETELATTITTTTSSSSNSVDTASVLSIPFASSTSSPAIFSMSNTLTQNLLNMLSDPIIAYSEQLQEASEPLLSDAESNEDTPSTSNKVCRPNIVHQMPSSIENNIASRGQNKNVIDPVNRDGIISGPTLAGFYTPSAADCTASQLETQLPLMHLTSPVKPDTKNHILTELPSNSKLDEDIEATTSALLSPTTSTATVSASNITIIQVTNNSENHQLPSTNTFNYKQLNKAAEVFTFREDTDSIHEYQHDDCYKSNVQIIPSSSNKNTIQIVSGPTLATVANQYSTTIKRNLEESNVDTNELSASVAIISPRSHLENHQITTLHVGNSIKTPATTTSVASVYGTCFASTETQLLGLASNRGLPNKTILSTNTSGVTNINVNNVKGILDSDSVVMKSNAIDNVQHNLSSLRYERVFLSSTILVATVNGRSETSTFGGENATQVSSRLTMSPIVTCAPPQSENNPCNILERFVSSGVTSSSLPSSPTPNAASAMTFHEGAPAQQNLNSSSGIQQQQRSLAQKVTAAIQSQGSPTSHRKARAVNSNVKPAPPVPTRIRLLTRGLTEAVITSRPSRKDFGSPKTVIKPRVESNSTSTSTSNVTTSILSNNNEEKPAVPELQQSQVEAAQVSSIRSNSVGRRRRSSSTSETQTDRTRAGNNNEFFSARVGVNALRMEQPPHSVAQQVPAGLSAVKRMTLREQQIMQLRREILHPGGVRLQLRRKDCIGSIAWIEAFGAIWIAGWKQKDHPVLYNALHIGDQLISIAGVTIIAAADANKVIRNTNTVFVEVLIRRIPLGRGYAIRREREGQCLGLIRDGNTSTIVDVVPNSLAAKHGLTPKAQSCDGSTLTFWVLTEINGRPLNLFFKDNEIRDRLNSVGRDISILVQPLDLIAKLKKQLKSMRGYKDYIVQ